MAYYKEPKYEEKEDDYFPFSSASIVAYEYKLLYHEKFFEHLHMKRLVIDENIPFPVSTWVCMCFYLLSVMAYFYVAIIIHCHRIGYKRE